MFIRADDTDCNIGLTISGVSNIETLSMAEHVPLVIDARGL